MIWHQNQAAKKEGRDLHLVFLDLVNAFGSIPHNFLWTAFAYFDIPEAMANLVQAYFQDIQLCLSTENFTTAWQPLEIGIMARCTISLFAFNMAMEIIIHASQWVVGWELMKPVPLGHLWMISPLSPPRWPEPDNFNRTTSSGPDEG